MQKYEILIFMFIRAHRERKFALMLDTLRYLVPLFFAMDHQNYARWVTVFIRDMEFPHDLLKTNLIRATGK